MSFCFHDSLLWAWYALGDFLTVILPQRKWRDWVEIRDGDNKNANLIGSRLGGSAIPDAMESSGSYMTIVFYTDGSSTRTGFRILTERGESKSNKKFRY